MCSQDVRFHFGISTRLKRLGLFGAFLASDMYLYWSGSFASHRQLRKWCRQLAAIPALS